jgi:hypothetical protein
MIMVMSILESYDIDVFLDKISKKWIKSLTEQEENFLIKQVKEYKYDGIKQNIGDSLDLLKELPDNSVDLVITSPYIHEKIL